MDDHRQRGAAWRVNGLRDVGELRAQRPHALHRCFGISQKVVTRQRLAFRDALVKQRLERRQAGRIEQTALDGQRCFEGGNRAGIGHAQQDIFRHICGDPARRVGKRERSHVRLEAAGARGRGLHQRPTAEQAAHGEYDHAKVFGA